MTGCCGYALEYGRVRTLLRLGPMHPVEYRGLANEVGEGGEHAEELSEQHNREEAKHHHEGSNEQDPDEGHAGSL